MRYGRDDCIVVVAFGATGLLLKAVKDYFRPFTHNIVFIDDTDPITVDFFLSSKYYVIIVSLTGETAETIFFAKLCRNGGTVITKQNSSLYNTAISNQLTFVDIDCITGFSVLNGASLTIASLLGIESKELMVSNSMAPIQFHQKHVLLLGSRRLIGILKWFAYAWNEHCREVDIVVHSISECVHGAIENAADKECIIFEDSSLYSHIPISTTQSHIVKGFLSNTRLYNIERFSQIAELCISTLKVNIPRPNNTKTMSIKSNMVQLYGLFKQQAFLT